MLDGERNLIEMAIKGEASAFGSLYDHYQPQIYRFILFKVSRSEEAEDLTHQVFLNAWVKIEDYKHLGFPFSGWLYQIARNAVIDHYRTRKSDSRLDDLSPEDLPSAPASDASAEANLELERVRKAIAKLKSEHQDVVIMRFIEELSIEETALVINKSPGAVKVIQHRAIKKLRDLLTTTDD